MALSSSTMAPPLSPKEPRRSNRRSVHSSTSTSKSSGSPSPDTTALPPPPTKESDAHSGRSGASASSSASNNRSKRTKEEVDDSHSILNAGHRRTTSVSSSHAVSASNTGKRTKRKGKEPPPPPPDEVLDTNIEESQEIDATLGEGADDEEAGVTRCVCDGLGPPSDDDAEFMIQCEICKVWQHGPCMGFAQESDIPQGDYYCEECKPEDHVELLKKIRRQRQNSEKAHHSRTSRSHSPSHFQQKSKRRNTMNSRDAAYEESVQQLLQTTAAEAAALNGDNVSNRAGSVAEEAVDEVVDLGSSGRKKRKRLEEESVSSKRKRSASVISERLTVTAPSEKLLDPALSVAELIALLPPPVPPPGFKPRNAKRGGRKNATVNDVAPSVDGEDGPAPTRKHPNQYTYRGKPGTNTQTRRAPPSVSGTSQTSAITHDHGTRRNASSTANIGSGNASRSAHNAYYNNIQQPMFTSWNLPDYLLHLQSILPNEVPSPLQIRGATSFFRDDLCTNATLPGVSVSSASETAVTALTANTASSSGGEVDTEGLISSNTAADQMAVAMANATESLTERGVKVKWPAKRMSVADMNKRVRALVEWVGREQALALERERRKTALESALRTHLQAQPSNTEKAKVDNRGPADTSKFGNDGETNPDTPSPMTVDNIATGIPRDEKQPLSTSSEHPEPNSKSANADGGDALPSLLDNISSRPSTTKMMEELMEELISFQERFGPGAKGQSKERSGRIGA